MNALEASLCMEPDAGKELLGLEDRTGEEARLPFHSPPTHGLRGGVGAGVYFSRSSLGLRSGSSQGQGRGLSLCTLSLLVGEGWGTSKG